MSTPVSTKKENSKLALNLHGLMRNVLGRENSTQLELGREIYGVQSSVNRTEKCHRSIDR